MKNWQIAVLAAVVSAILLSSQSATSQQTKPPKHQGLFSALHVGQSVFWFETHHARAIHIFEDEAKQDQMQAKVVEIGDDYIVLDLPELNGIEPRQLRVPASALAGIVRFKKSANGKEPDIF